MFCLSQVFGQDWVGGGVVGADFFGTNMAMASSSSSAEGSNASGCGGLETVLWIDPNLAMTAALAVLFFFWPFVSFFLVFSTFSASPSVAVLSRAEPE